MTNSLPPTTPGYLKVVCSVHYKEDVSILRVAILFLLFTWNIINLAFSKYKKRGQQPLSCKSDLLLDRNYLFRYKILIFTLLILMNDNEMSLHHIE